MIAFVKDIKYFDQVLGLGCAITNIQSLPEILKKQNTRKTQKKAR